MNRIAIAIVLPGMTLAACDNQYIERKDMLSLGAGDAVATNMAAHVHDPWPPRSADDRIPMDGVKAGTALIRYRAGPAPGGAGGGAPPGA
ncbi:MAG: hypothetical protein N2444_01010, partial [Methylocystis sp.]|nr:hypothetical protein [Methylocystis sp.]